MEYDPDTGVMTVHDLVPGTMLIYQRSVYVIVSLKRIKDAGVTVTLLHQDTLHQTVLTIERNWLGKVSDAWDSIILP
jgi:hypothetical protein